MVLHYAGGLCGQVGRGGRYGVLRRHHANRSGINLATTEHRRCRTRPLAGWSFQDPVYWTRVRELLGPGRSDFLLLYLALETVSLHSDACLTNRLCLAATFTPLTTRRSSTPRWSGPLLRRRDRLRLSPDVFGDMRNWKTERISTVARTATRLPM
jgi:hypothetical protein